MTISSPQAPTQPPPPRQRRRTSVAWWAIGALAVLVFVLMLTVPSRPAAPTPAAPTPAAPAAAASPVGTWDMDVTIHTPTPTSAHLTCTIEATHHLRCLARPGQPPLQGDGVWNTVDDGTFAFWITHHAQVDAQGNPTGSIYAEHVAQLSGQSFSTHGFTFIDMHDGKPWIGPVAVEATAHRVSA